MWKEAAVDYFTFAWRD